MAEVEWFTTIPVQVQAIQFRGWSNARQLWEWCGGFFVPRGAEHKLRTVTEHDRSTGHILDDAPAFFVIMDGDTAVRVHQGEWVVQVEDGVYRKFTAAGFEFRYEKSKDPK